MVIDDKIPCDLVLLSINKNSHLIVKEVSLTGESYEIEKIPYKEDKDIGS